MHIINRKSMHLQQLGTRFVAINYCAPSANSNLFALVCGPNKKGLCQAIERIITTSTTTTSLEIYRRYRIGRPGASHCHVYKQEHLKTKSIYSNYLYFR